MGMLVPHQPMGLGPWAMVQGEPLYPTGFCVLPDLPEQGPDAFANAFPQQAGDTNINDIFAWLNTVDCMDTVPDVPNSPSLTAFVHELPNSYFLAQVSSSDTFI